jgi:hypothetical protein
MGCHSNSWCKKANPLMQFKGLALITPVCLQYCHKGYCNRICNALLILKETAVQNKQWYGMCLYFPIRIVPLNVVFQYMLLKTPKTW